tara:strand:+ start:455 stop:808 length:354 start_codon:yes stop_codon:yes gene_type:complete
MDIVKAETIIKPWGKEEILANTEKYVMKRITINPGSRMSLQYHEIKEETIYVVEGVLINWKTEEMQDHFTLMPGETYHVKPGVVHRFGSPNEMKTVIIECSTIELDDVVRLADDYDR